MWPAAWVSRRTSPACRGGTSWPRPSSAGRPRARRPDPGRGGRGPLVAEPVEDLRRAAQPVGAARGHPDQPAAGVPGIVDPLQVADRDQPVDRLAGGLFGDAQPLAQLGGGGAVAPRRPGARSRAAAAAPDAPAGPARRAARRSACGSRPAAAAAAGSPAGRDQRVAMFDNHVYYFDNHVDDPTGRGADRRTPGRRGIRPQLLKAGNRVPVFPAHTVDTAPAAARPTMTGGTPPVRLAAQRRWP